MKTVLPALFAGEAMANPLQALRLIEVARAAQGGSALSLCRGLEPAWEEVFLRLYRGGFIHVKEARLGPLRLRVPGSRLVSLSEAGRTALELEDRLLASRAGRTGRPA